MFPIGVFFVAKKYKNMLLIKIDKTAGMMTGIAPIIEPEKLK